MGSNMSATSQLAKIEWKTSVTAQAVIFKIFIMFDPGLT